MKKERDITIDILKTVGILMIILAHTNPPNIIFQIRNFDVSLLIIISAMLGAYSYNKYKSDFKYFIKRIIRLILPVWIFLTILFVLLYFFKICTLDISIPNLKTIIDSYLLLDGIGYVWIIRVYVLCAIGLLILLKMKKKIKPSILKILLVLIYVIYEILFYFIGNNNFLMKYIVYYMIPYGLICTYIGLELKKMTNKQILTFSAILIIIFMILSVYFFIIQKQFVLTNNYKYPPRIYYLSYSIGISLLLYYIIGRKNILSIKEKLDIKIIKFISEHSMWIYLWHIFFVLIINKLSININFIIKYIIYVSGGLLMTYIQIKFVEKLHIKNKTIVSILSK